ILTNGSEEVFLITRRGKALRISEGDVRAMGRSSRGVTGIRLAQGDELTAALKIEADAKMLLITEFGYGKRVNFDEFNPHGRATGGQKIYDVKEKTGEIIGATTLADTDELVCITSQGKTLRVKASVISEQSRGAQGVRILNIDMPDMVIGVDKIAESEDQAEFDAE
ncbi:MAG: DNA gyrase C-terminal beta-propeller domain-containing protein, partial [Treponemataceae bacterium]